MKNKIAPWMVALVCAITIHILIIEVSDSQHWFDINTQQPSTFELFLLPATQTAQNNKSAEEEVFSQNKATRPEAVQQAETTQATEETQPAETKQAEQIEEIDSITPTEPLANIVSEKPTGKELSERSNGFDPQEVINNIDNKQQLSEAPLQDSILSPSLNTPQLSSDKPELLDLSKVSLSPDVKEEALTGVFSEELRDKIAESKKAQKDYLKGLTKEVDYPITKDADGTRYVNIKGVCWRLPKEGSNEGWAIVFDGCGIKSKLFHFELNISPSIITNELLGPDSPFNLDQTAK